MSRRPTPTVNASLIHEARMIVQQFITGRQQMHHAARLAGVPARVTQKPPVCIHPVLKCCFCVDKIVDAVVVMNGFSVCAQHEPNARHSQPITIN